MFRRLEFAVSSGGTGKWEYPHIWAQSEERVRIPERLELRDVAN